MNYYDLFIYILTTIAAISILGIVRNTIYIHRLVKLEEAKTVASIKNKKQPFLSSSLNYENDIKFLHSMIDDAIYDRVKELTIIKVDYLNGKEYRSIVEDICFRVRDRLSDTYKNEMEKYFSPEGFDEYMIKKISMKVLTYVETVNRPK